MIEFDDALPDDDGADEDLPQPRERRWPVGTRTRRALAVAAAVVVGGGIVAYAQFAHPDGSAESAHSGAPSPTSTAPVPGVTTSPGGGGLLVEHLGDRNGTLRNDVEVSVPAHLVAPACPQSTDGFASCVVSTSVPSGLVAAVHARFPAAQTPSVSTATLRATDPGSRPGLWSRLYRAQLRRGGTLTILVTRNESDVDVAPTVVLFGDTTIAYVKHATARYRVEVQVRAPTSHAPSLAGLSALAADARLVRS